MKLYDTWQQIRKTTASKRTDTKQKTENAFVDALDDLFDISHADALNKHANRRRQKFSNPSKRKRPTGMYARCRYVVMCTGKKCNSQKRQRACPKEKINGNDAKIWYVRGVP